MPEAPGSLLSTVLGLAAALAALALFVQVVQELYKFLTSSRARCYERVLEDALGPWIGQVKRQASALELSVRGPLQFLRRRPTGVVLPLRREDLARALERTAPDRQRRALEAIRVEAERWEAGAAAPSPAWESFLEELRDAEDWAAREVRSFLEERGADFDPAALERDFRRRFLPHVERVRELHPRIAQNLEYAYRRRNLRQTVVLGLLLAVLANLPLGRLYRAAAGVDGSLAEPFLLPLASLREAGPEGILAYLAGCILTAILLTFGAPFWHDLAGAVAAVSSRRRSPGEPAPPEPGDGD